MKKLLAIVLTLVCIVSLTACNTGSGSNDGEISVFYYTYSDTYISSVRSAMDKILKDAGKTFNNYDANRQSDHADRTGYDCNRKGLKAPYRERCRYRFQ